jgi:hypothetical protein
MIDLAHALYNVIPPVLRDHCWKELAQNVMRNQNSSIACASVVVPVAVAWFQHPDNPIEAPRRNDDDDSSRVLATLAVAIPGNRFFL